MNWYEVNFDGLVGPTHNYAGLSYGNLASTKHKSLDSSPKQAALEGLAKMDMVRQLGRVQAVLPPQLRPNLSFLRGCGFCGSNPEEVIQSVASTDPILLAAASSSASMWTANAATVSPSVDCRDGKTHLTVANLFSGLHRSHEAVATFRVLSQIFEADGFVVHESLSTADALSDEGAANHMRLAPQHAGQGIEIFVYGRDAFTNRIHDPQKFPARQTLQASQAVARLHALDPDRTLFWKQNPVAIDQGAFHNDVVAVANESVLLCHQESFVNQAQQFAQFRELYQSCFQLPPTIIEVSSTEIDLEEAVKTYLFNSQLVSDPNGRMTLIAPMDCRRSDRVRQRIEQMIKDENPIDDVVYPEVRQSMDNGGGPACLRLRVVLNEKQLDQIHQGIRFTSELHAALVDWVHRHYRDRLAIEDLADPILYRECEQALVELESLLDFPAGVLAPKDSIAFS